MVKRIVDQDSSRTTTRVEHSVFDEKDEKKSVKKKEEENTGFSINRFGVIAINEEENQQVKKNKKVKKVAHVRDIKSIASFRSYRLSKKSWHRLFNTVDESVFMKYSVKPSDFPKDFEKKPVIAYTPSQDLIQIKSNHTIKIENKVARYVYLHMNEKAYHDFCVRNFIIYVSLTVFFFLGLFIWYGANNEHNYFDGWFSGLNNDQRSMLESFLSFTGIILPLLMLLIAVMYSVTTANAFYQSLDKYLRTEYYKNRCASCDSYEKIKHLKRKRAYLAYRMRYISKPIWKEYIKKKYRKVFGIYFKRKNAVTPQFTQQTK